MQSIFDFTGFDITTPPEEGTVGVQAFERELQSFLAASANTQLVEGELALPFMPDLAERQQRAQTRHVYSFAHADVERLYRLEHTLRTAFPTLAPLETARYWFLIGTGALSLGRWHDAMDAFTTCAYLLENPTHAAQRIQLYYYWGRAALHAQRAQEALLSLDHALMTFRRLTNEQRQRCLQRDYESFDCYLNTQLARAESISGHLEAAHAHTETALNFITQWINEQNTDGVTIPRRRNGILPLQAIKPDVWHSANPNDQIWGALALTIPWHAAENATWQARLHNHKHGQERNQILHDQAYSPMRNLITFAQAAFAQNNSPLDMRQEAGILNLHLSTLDIALSGITLNQGSEHALTWLPRAVGLVSEIGRRFPAVADPDQQTYFTLQREATAFQNYFLGGLAPQPVIANLQRQADALKEQNRIWLAGHAERFLGQCYYNTKNFGAASVHYHIALEYFEAEAPPHAFSPHSAELRQALADLKREG